MFLVKIKNKITSLYYSVTSSIAFYPSIISFGLFALAFIMLTLEDVKLTKFLIENASYLVIDNSETARSILSTLIGGIISLTVFSFSMVMVLLNQASSNFSPRLLPGLISNKENQIVLGFYIGTILYNIIVLISILPSGDSYTLNGFSILIGIVLGVVCLGLFVYFIHSISSTIQIENILKRTFDDAKCKLQVIIDRGESENQISFKSPSSDVVRSKKSGHFQGASMESLLDFAEEYKTDILICPVKGEYLLPNVTVFKSAITLDEDQKNILQDLILFSSSPEDSNNYVLGIQQITEVGVKAMSPGINDPGTALSTVDFLTELLSMRMLISEHDVRPTEDGNFHVKVTTMSFVALLDQTLAAYRQYCKHDYSLMDRLLHMLHYLKRQKAVHDSYQDEIEKQLEAMKEDIEQHILNSHDKASLLSKMEADND